MEGLGKPVAILIARSHARYDRPLTSSLDIPQGMRHHPNISTAEVRDDMSAIQRIVVIGAGAMGGYYASRFFDMDRDSVSLLAGGDRCRRLRDEGLIVNGKPYGIPVIGPDEIDPPSDLVLVAVKYHHLPDAIRDMERRIGDETVILSVMNGIDSEERIGAVYGMDRVLYCVALAIDAMRVGNRIMCTQLGKLFFGEAKNRVLTDRVRRLQALLDRAGLAHETPEDMIRVLWWKFMINVGINQASAVLRAPYGVFQTTPEAEAIMDSAMREVMAVAHAEGIDLSEGDIRNWHEILSNLAPNAKTSMLQDMEAGRKTEVEMFAGKLLELGRRHGIPTPVNDVLFRLIKVMEQRSPQK
jgi:2-dehydropantoate 2-reductase